MQPSTALHDQVPADLLARYDRPVPRYTSYPTAPHFHAGVDAATYAAWLGALDPAAALSLYVHIPFCARLCWFCGCHTRVVNRYEPVAAYVGTLLCEARAVAAALGPRHPAVALHWGGGSPTLLKPDDVRRLADGIFQVFGRAPGHAFAVEVDPRGLTPALAAALAEAGVNRASLGVQDLDPAVQAAVNRHQSLDVTAEAVRLLRGHGIAAINIDLMYGLPGQTLDGLLRTVDSVAALAPDRMALFGYAHVPWMKQHQQLIDARRLPDGAGRWRQMTAAARRIREHGYVAVGIDHFARPDDPLAHAHADGTLGRGFQGYTADTGTALVGLGASAIGMLPQGYVQNLVAVRDYQGAIAGGRLATARGVALTAEDRLRRAVIERLLCDFAADVPALAAAHGLPAPTLADAADALAPLAADGLVVQRDGCLAITECGRPFARVVAAAFDAYLRPGMRRHARAV